MKRRLTIARAPINEPELLLLDEPATGLDPQARHLVWERLFRPKQQGVTLVLTTHYMDEAEQRCDRLVVMGAGRIAAEGSPRDLIERYSTREVVPAARPPSDPRATPPLDASGAPADLDPGPAHLDPAGEHLVHGTGTHALAGDPAGHLDRLGGRGRGERDRRRG